LLLLLAGPTLLLLLLLLSLRLYPCSFFLLLQLQLQR
jgi:hypothetical protein